MVVGVSLTETPHGQRPPGQRFLWTGNPPGQRPPWIETPWTEIPPSTETPPGQRPPWTETPQVNRITYSCKNIPCRNFVTGGNQSGGKN